MTDLTKAAREALEALNAMLTHMGMDEDEWNKPTFNQAHAGMSLRDYFAAKAMQGMVAAEYGRRWTPNCWAHHAYILADAMLKAREVERLHGITEGKEGGA